MIFLPTLTYDARWVIEAIDLLSYKHRINPNVFLDFVEDFTFPSWINSGMCAHIIEQIIVARCSRRSYLESFALALKFSLPSICQAFYLLFVKICARFF